MRNKGVHTMKFTVLMTVYAKETPECFDSSLKSILVDQTVLPDQFVLVYDGPVTDELKAVTEKYRKLFPNTFDVLELPENVGQGAASRAGVQLCKHELLARMDSDDISYKERFQMELAVFEEDPDVDVVAGFITEFTGDPANITSVKTVPETHEQIVKRFRKRNPVNNVTVMYKKEALEQAGGYLPVRANEDFNLYIRLLLAGKKFYNIQQPLVNVRVGSNMLERRGKIDIFYAWKSNQKLLLQGGIINWPQYVMNCAGCYFFVKCPVPVKRFLYRYVLRKTGNSQER